MTIIYSLQLAHVLTSLVIPVMLIAMLKKEKSLVNALASQMLRVKIVIGANQIIGIWPKIIH